jgi:hypothetical protein
MRTPSDGDKLSKMNLVSQTLLGEFDATYNSCNIKNLFGVIKSRRMKWEGHVARMGREEV